MSFRESLAEPNIVDSSSVEPVRENGIWSTFCDSQGESASFAMLSA
jgi:hypothetical protein